MYDIETHYQYEYGRGVAELSTMKRAMGGRHRFPTQSPALILNSACGGKAKIKLPGIAESPVGSRYGLCCDPTVSGMFQSRGKAGASESRFKLYQTEMHEQHDFWAQMDQALIS